MLKNILLLVALGFSPFTQSESDPPCDKVTHGIFYVCTEGKKTAAIPIAPLRYQLEKFDIPLPDAKVLKKMVTGGSAYITQVTKSTMLWPRHSLMTLNIEYKPVMQNWVTEPVTIEYTWNWGIIIFFSMVSLSGFLSGLKKSMRYDMFMTYYILTIAFVGVASGVIVGMKFAFFASFVTGVVGMYISNTKLLYSIVGTVGMTLLVYFFAYTVVHETNHGWQPFLNLLSLSGIPIVFEIILTSLRWIMSQRNMVLGQRLP